VVQGQISVLKTQIAQVQNSIGLKEQEIAAKEEEIAAKQEEIAAKQGEIDAQWSAFKGHMAAMQELREGGSVAMLSSVTNLYELLTFNEALQDISVKDTEILTNMRNAKEALENDKLQLEEQRTELKTQKADLQSKKADLDAQNNQMSAKQKELNSSVAAAKMSAAEAQQAQKDAQAAIGNTVTIFMIISVSLTMILLIFINPIVAVMDTPAEAVKGITDYSCSRFHCIIRITVLFNMCRDHQHWFSKIHCFTNRLETSRTGISSATCHSIKKLHIINLMITQCFVHPYYFLCLRLIPEKS
jgi:hypothetical protein